MKKIIIVGYNDFTKEVIKKIKTKKNIKIILKKRTFLFNVLFIC